MTTKTFLAEFAGTFIFLSVIVVASESFGTQHRCLLPIAVAFGLLAALLISAPISGGHLNPAISVMAILNDPSNTLKYSLYIIAQLLAVILVLFFTKGLLLGK